MKLQIVERSGELFKGHVSSVTVPLLDGELGILPGHTPLLAVLQPGQVRFVTNKGEEKSVQTGRGFVTLDSDEIMVVVDPYPVADDSE